MHLPDASSPVALAGQRTANAVEAERTKVQNLVAEFESMLIAQMLRGLKDAMAPEADEGGLGGAIMGDTVTTELAAALGRSGGLGLSELVSTALARVEAGARPASSRRRWRRRWRDGWQCRRPGRRRRHGRRMVTSAFGWRADRCTAPGAPCRRRPEAAYGQPILAATGGVVTAVGERAGYGLIVTVDHGNGLETRTRTCRAPPSGGRPRRGRRGHRAGRRHRAGHRAAPALRATRRRADRSGRDRRPRPVAKAFASAADQQTERTRP